MPMSPSSITITNAGLNLLKDAMSGANTGVIKYVALGTSSTTPTVGDTKLGAESYRKLVTSYTNGGSPGELLINAYIAPAEDVGDPIAEIGFFGGGSATSAANSGVLLARGLYSHTKTNVESLQVQLDITI